MVVDRQPLWLDIVDSVLGDTGFDVSFKTVCSSSALDHLELIRPDLLVTGLRMLSGDVEGYDLVREARAKRPRMRIVVLSGLGGDEPVAAAFHAGADAFVRKSAPADDLATAVRQAFQHSLFLPAPALEPPELAVELTICERAILRHLAEGHSNVQIARMLWVTEQTVDYHVASICGKLGAADRDDAVRCAGLHALPPRDDGANGDRPGSPTDN
jgi:DNA-binding NarL/FixJ family response regulator